MLWTPEEEWKGQDAYIIGGGSSLRRFNFHLLTGHNVIGCNDAFRLGPKIISYTMFGDASYFHKMKHQLKDSGTKLVTCAPSIEGLNFPGMRQLKRKSSGLARGSTVGWNFSTGAAAVNLALTLGAKRVFLLGIDLVRDQKDRSHWHNYRATPTRDAVLERFLHGFQAVHRDLNIVFQEREVIHVFDGESRMPFFRHMTFDHFYQHLVDTRRNGNHQTHAEAEGRLLGAVC